MNPIPINLVFEDQVSEFVMAKLVEKEKKFQLSYSYTEGGFGYIRRNIRGWNQAAKGCPFFILTDLDQNDCAPNLIKEWLPIKQHPNLIFRVAVKEVETWLLADIEGFSKFTGISSANFIENTETIWDAKAELFRLIRRCRKRAIREDILPKNEFAKVGPNYNERLCEFVMLHWNIERAMKRSDSLKRAMEHLKNFNVVY
ncbi:MAG: hypothetical protein NTX61_05815 [Bacteroidetes bacterium]|nr:hypothetical protein [Bacteroidota bacterium]